jgi:curved DNA-binding protein CbpA
MQNHYDLLGVRPDDDAENIKKAFRKAAKASHPDHHGGDPQAVARFTQISEAYEILRDAEQRAAYDRQLEFKRGPLRHELKRSGTKRHVVQDLMAGGLVAVMLAVGYELVAHVAETPVDAAADITARESGQAAADDPAERIAAARLDRSERALAPQVPVAAPTAPVTTASNANDHDRPEMTKGEPASNTAGQIAVASRESKSDLATGASVPGKTNGEPPVRHDMPSLQVPFSAAEEHSSVPAADDRHDGKTPETAGANTGGVKPPEIKMSPRARVAAKRHAPSRPAFDQATMESRSTAAPNNPPPRVLVVGF